MILPDKAREAVQQGRLDVQPSGPQAHGPLALGAFFVPGG
jgi:hypothetical protein